MKKELHIDNEEDDSKTPFDENQPVDINDVDLEFDEVIDGEFDHHIVDTVLEKKKKEINQLSWVQGTKWVNVSAIEFNWVFNTK